MKEVVCFRTSPDTKEKLLGKVKPKSNVSELLNDLVVKFLDEKDNSISSEHLHLMLCRSLFLRRRVSLMYRILVKIKTEGQDSERNTNELLKLIKDTYTEQKRFNYTAP